jgi:hypothetical protein
MSTCKIHVDRRGHAFVRDHRGESTGDAVPGVLEKGRTHRQTLAAVRLLCEHGIEPRL